MTKKIKIDAFPSEPLQSGRYVKAAINSYLDLISYTCREAKPHNWDPRVPCHGPKLTKKFSKRIEFPQKLIYLSLSLFLAAVKPTTIF